MLMGAISCPPFQVLPCPSLASSSSSADWARDSFQAQVGKTVWQGLVEGWIGLALPPDSRSSLMAASIRYIIDGGGVTDTILHTAAEPFQQLGAFPAPQSSFMYWRLGIEFFVASRFRQSLPDDAHRSPAR